MTKNLKNMLIAAGVALSPMIAGNVYGSEAQKSNAIDAIYGNSLVGIDLKNKQSLKDYGYQPPYRMLIYIDPRKIFGTRPKTDEEIKKERLLQETVQAIRDSIESKPEKIPEFSILKDHFDDTGWTQTEWVEITKNLLENNVSLASFLKIFGDQFPKSGQIEGKNFKELEGKTIVQQLSYINTVPTFFGRPSILVPEKSPEEESEPSSLFNAFFVAYLSKYSEYSYPSIWAIFDARKVLDNLRPGWRELAQASDTTDSASSSSSSPSSEDTREDKK